MSGLVSGLASDGGLPS